MKMIIFCLEDSKEINGNVIIQYFFVSDIVMYFVFYNIYFVFR